MARLDCNGRWRYRRMGQRPTGERVRISGVAPKRENTREVCELIERAHVEAIANGHEFPARQLVIVVPSQPSLGPSGLPRVVPTFEEWFNGRYWNEWVIAEGNKPSVQIKKQSVFRTHLKDELGQLPLDRITVEVVQKLRFTLVAEKKLCDKSINNVMGVLSKALRYAVEADLIPRAPRCRMKKVERPEIELWSYDGYVRILDGARSVGLFWYVAACLAGEAGLRI